MSPAGNNPQSSQKLDAAFLPTPLAGILLVCGCFGVGSPQMKAVLAKLRAQESEPDKHFPEEITRELLRRAKLGQGKWLEAIATVASQALYDRLLRETSPPTGSVAGHFADRLSNSLPRLYHAAVPKLRVDGIPPQRVLWILVEEMFIPTAFLELKAARRRGLGTEFGTETCWYLPRVEKGQVVKPFQRVLQIWMNAVGFRFACDFKKQAGSLGRKVQDWLKGKYAASPEGIREMVGQFSDEARRFDNPEEWIGRLGLAAGMQELCVAVDQYFAPIYPNASLRFADLIKVPELGEVPVDLDGVLGQPRTFFAARLIQRRWKAEGIWQQRIASAQPSAPPHPSPDASDQELEDYRNDLMRLHSSGDHFLDALITELCPSAKAEESEMQKGVFFSDFLFDRGLEELNAILDRERCGGQSARRI